MIGARLRELRLNRNLTLEQVANETGLSMSFLSMLERDKVSISVDNLQKLAGFYGVRMVHFFQGIEEAQVAVTRRSQVEERLASAQEGRSAFLLLANRTDARMEPLLVRIPGGHGDPHFRTHEGDTLLYVLEGEIQLISERGEEISLSAGDAAYYFGFPGRRIQNASPVVPALILLVTNPPTSMRDDILDAQRGIVLQTEE
ncbi:MAG TPA: XRE family transcriptional regulator [Anaerolineaceae bacterium]